MPDETSTPEPAPGREIALAFTRWELRLLTRALLDAMATLYARKKIAETTLTGADYEREIGMFNEHARLRRRIEEALAHARD